MLGENMDAQKLQMVDISAQVFGKYQYCTKNKADGMWYSDDDFSAGAGCGSLKRGALPSPRQDTPELTAKARAMHQATAKRDADHAANVAANAARRAEEDAQREADDIPASRLHTAWTALKRIFG